MKRGRSLPFQRPRIRWRKSLQKWISNGKRGGHRIWWRRDDQRTVNNNLLQLKEGNIVSLLYISVLWKREIGKKGRSIMGEWKENVNLKNFVCVLC